MNPTDINKLLRRTWTNEDMRQDAWVLMLKRDTPPTKPGHVLWAAKVARIDAIRKDRGEGKRDNRMEYLADPTAYSREPSPDHMPIVRDQLAHLARKYPDVLRFAGDCLNHRGQLSPSKLAERMGSTVGRIDYLLDHIRSTCNA